jgi:hypothetical protein
MTFASYPSRLDLEAEVVSVAHTYDVTVDLSLIAGCGP